MVLYTSAEEQKLVARGMLHVVCDFTMWTTALVVGDERHATQNGNFSSDTFVEGNVRDSLLWLQGTVSAIKATESSLCYAAPLLSAIVNVDTEA